MEKVIRDGKVAVLYSPGFGAGWSTWCDDENLIETLLFHPLLIEMVEEGKEKYISSRWLVYNFGEEFDKICVLGKEDLKIKWLPEGTRFRIDEYDGFETVEVFDDVKFYIA